MDGVNWLSLRGLERGRVVTSEFVNGWCPLGLLIFVRILASTLREVGFPGCKESSGKESACQCQRCERCGFHLWVEKIPWGRKWQPTPVFLSGKFCGQRSLAGYSPWSCRVRHDWAQLSWEKPAAIRQLSAETWDDPTSILPRSFWALSWK